MSCDIEKCKAECCGAVPIDGKIVKKYLGKIKGEFDIIPSGIDGTIIIMHKGTTTCAFLNEAHRCSIYKHRPEVCRMFGNTDHPLMKCHHLGQITKEEGESAVCCILDKIK